MSLVISMEDVDGQDVNMEVLPHELFQTFIQRASEILGYDVPLSSIVGDTPVSLSDNVYDFLMQMAVPEGEEDEEFLQAAPAQEDAPPEDFSQPADEMLQVLVNDQTKTLAAEQTELPTPAEEHIDFTIDESVNNSKISAKRKTISIKREDNSDDDYRSADENTYDTQSSDVEDDDIEFLEEHLEEEEEEEYLEEQMDTDEKYDYAKSSPGDKPKVLARIRDEKPQKTVTFAEDIISRINGSENVTSKSRIDDTFEDENVIESDLPMVEIDDDNGEFMEVEFLDEDILELDAESHLKNLGHRNMDLEDELVSYTIVKHDEEGKKPKKRQAKPETKDKNKERLMKIEEDSKDDVVRAEQVYTREELLDLLEGSESSDSDVETKILFKKDKFKMVKTARKKPGKELPIIEMKKPKRVMPPSEEIKDVMATSSLSSSETKMILDLIKGVSQPEIKVMKLDTETENARRFGNGLQSAPHNLLKYSRVKVEEMEDDVDGDLMSVEDDSGAPFLCRMCGSRLYRIAEVVTHSLTHKMPDRAIFPCILCQFGFTSFPEVRRHIRSAHGHLDARPVSRRPAGPLCSKPALDEPEPAVDAPEDILEEWLDEEDMLVYHCGAEFPAPIKTEFKAEKETKGDEPEPYEDEESAQESGTEAEMMEEEEIEEEEYPDRSFEEQAVLDMEEFESLLKLKGNRKPASARNKGTFDSPERKLSDLSYRCGLCGQAFHTERRLIFHRSFHQAELLGMGLRCPKCGEEGLPDELALYRHINTHPVLFTCGEPGCGKDFRLRSSLKSHGRIHGKKRHRCEVCGKQFFDTQNLKEHKITHLKVKPFQCHICLKFMNRRSRLRMHLLAHEAQPSENSVLACRSCHMAFRTTADAESHARESDQCREDVERNPVSGYELPREDSSRDQLEADLERLLAEDQSQTKIEQNHSETDYQIQVQIKLEDSGYKISAETEVSKALEHIFEGSVEAELAEGSVEEQLQAAGLLLEDGGPAIEEIGGVAEEPAEDVQMAASVNDKEEIAMAGTFDVLIDQKDCDNLEAGAIALGDEESADEEPPRELEEEEEVKKPCGEDMEGELTPLGRLCIHSTRVSMVYRCEFCERVFCKKEALIQHRQLHYGKKLPYICNVCNGAYSTYARVTSHKTSHGFFKSSADDGPESSASKMSGYEEFPVVKYFLCHICSKTFLHFTYLQVHRKNKHEMRGHYTCNICLEEFPESSKLSHHKRKVHPEVLKMQRKSANFSYKCADCGETYGLRKDLAKHRELHHGDSTLMQLKTKPGPFSCTECYKVYQTKVGLEGHMRIHNGGAYLCDLCGNGFAHRAGLDTHHKRVHLKEQSHSCEECGQSFFSSAELFGHRRCHTGEKPFPCTYCPMYFRTKGRRNEHHRIHTGERPYPCDVCGLAFRRSHAMKNHRLIHTGERQHACPHCSKMFHVKSNLNSHIKQKHSGQLVVLEVEGGAEVRAALEQSLRGLQDQTLLEIQEEAL